jgi:hypothetical protein
LGPPHRSFRGRPAPACVRKLRRVPPLHVGKARQARRGRSEKRQQPWDRSARPAAQRRRTGIRSSRLPL